MTNNDGFTRIDSDSDPQVFYPWRRYLARTVDISIYSMLWLAFIALVFHVNITRRGSILGYIDLIIAMGIMLLIEPLLLKLLGTTIGKWIFGLHIKDEEGNNSSYISAFNRTWGVIKYGLGYNIPFYNFYTMYKCYKRCKEKENQPWDNELKYTIKDTKIYRGFLFVGVNILILGINMLIIACAQMPPNRGDLTIAEFAENYNMLSSYYGIESGKYLDKNAKWANKSYDNGTIYFDVFNTPFATFEFETIDNKITQISYEIEIKNSEEWLSSSNTQMILAALSFIGAQKDVGILSKIRREIPSFINQNTFNNFNFIHSNIDMNCIVEVSGYEGTHSRGNLLIPKENEETYYHLVFTIVRN